MTKMNMIASLNSALRCQLEKDPNIVIFGEDVGYFGGVFRVTDGLQKDFGAHRVFDAPLAEGGIAAIAMGMSLNGLRPVAEIQFADYIFPAYDQIVNEIAKIRHRSGGEFSAPLTIRTPAGGGIKGGQVYGRTDEIGWGVEENPVHANDLHATMLKLFGMNHELLTYRFQGRDFRLTDVAGKVINDWIA